MSPIERRAGLLAAALLAAASAGAQPGESPVPPSVDVPPPPRLDDPAPEPRETRPAESLDRPSAARLAPLPDEAADAIEEIVVVADQSWRLPDLGTAMRLEREAEEARNARIQVTYLAPPQPFDPLDPAMWTVDPEARRVGYINLFRIRFGRRN